MNRRIWILVLLVMACHFASSALAAPLSWDAKEFMGIDELKPGMTGYGKTVYQGTKIETFGVTVIGVLKKVDFGFDMILIKVTSGPVVERKLQTVAGMSGSPIYIKNRLIGAYAYGWDFQQEPIAGVTPIAAMLECTQPGSSIPPKTGTLRPANRVLHIGDTLITNIKVAASHTDAAALQAKADPTTMVLSPVATPLFVSGMPEQAMKPMQRFFDQYNLRAMPGPGQMPGRATPLEPGSAVAVSLMEGDANLSAVGTVTYVKGDTVLAFGHPFLGTGKANLPMSTAYVQGIVNSSMSSFKMASPVARVGTLTSDRQFAVGGVVGQQPELFPVGLNLSDASRNYHKQYAVKMINDPAFTPFILYMYVLFSGGSQIADMSSAEGTFTGHFVVATEKLGKIQQNMVVSPQASMDFYPMIEFYLLTDALMLNPYEPVKITGASINLSYQPERNFATIEKVLPDRPVVRPGETVNLKVYIRPYGKPVETREVTLAVPKYAAEPNLMVLVAGGANAMMFKQQLFPQPSPEEGVDGIVRWLTDIPSSQSIYSAEILPSPSYAYRGTLLRNLPGPALDALRFADSITGTPQADTPDGEQSDSENSQNTQGNVRPAVYQFTQDVPYILTGGQMITLAIDTPERRAGISADNLGGGARVPVLSASLAPSPESDSNDEMAMLRRYAAMNWYTPAQRQRQAIVLETLSKPYLASHMSFHLPTMNYPQTEAAYPLSLATADAPKAKDGHDDAQVTDEENTANDDADTDEDTDEADDTDSADRDTTLLTHAHPSWGLTSRNDFLKGVHLGTAVTSQGTLVLMPRVRSLYQTSDIIPWRVVTTTNGIYVAGWGKSTVTRLTADGKSDVVFSATATDAGKSIAITALTADNSGNLLIGSYPDQHVRLISPTGSVLRSWTLPGNTIWALAVTSDGRRYAAVDQDTLYLLRDDQQQPVQEACTVPDKAVIALTTDRTGHVYLATSPRGKVYRLDGAGKLTSVYEAKGSVASLAVDERGTVYVGTTPSCRVMRIAPDGTQTMIMKGEGNGNKHVTALQLVGDDLYAATAPSGGIYRITNPTAATPIITPIYAREDLRTGDDELAQTGPESVLVNALAVTAAGNVIAACSTPGQVLLLEPRTHGAYLSSVLPAPAVAQWGQVEVHASRYQTEETISPVEAVRIETRSGRTSWPDATWSTWAPLTDGQINISPSATFAQIRVVFIGDPATALDYLRAHYLPVNQAPTVTVQAPTAGNFWHEKQDVKWKGIDPDEDVLVYTASISADGGRHWTPIPVKSADDEEKKDAGKADDTKTTDDADTATKTPEKPITPTASADKTENRMETEESSFSWDTTSVTDGGYLMKIVASDKYAKPTSAKSAEAITSLFTVDNTAPTTTLPDTVTSWDALKQFVVTDALTPLVGGKYRLDGGPWTAVVAADGIFDSKEETVQLVSATGPITLTDGPHTLELLVEDSAGNQLDRSITVNIGGAAVK